MTVQPKVLGLIAVINKAGESIFSQPVLDDRQGIWKDYVGAYGVKQVEGLPWPVISIPEENAVWTRVKPLSCLYNANKGIISNLFGTTLDADDQAFFDVHPLANAAGVGLPNTLRVVQELIEP